MDAFVFVGRGTVGRWDVYARDPKDLLLGTIEEGDNRQLLVKAAAGPLFGIDEGPYPDLEAAMSAVAARIGGTCEKWVP